MNMDKDMKELDQEHMDMVSGGKIRYRDLRNIPLTEEDRKELEELERRVSNS